MDADVDAGGIAPAVKLRLRAVDAEGGDKHVRGKRQIGRREAETRAPASALLHSAGHELAVAEQPRGNLTVAGAQKRADGR